MSFRNGRENMVCVAIRRDACVGYFEIGAALPEGWEESGEHDISHIMSANSLTKGQALDMMNQHWK